MFYGYPCILVQFNNDALNPFKRHFSVLNDDLDYNWLFSSLYTVHGASLTFR